MVCQKKIYTGLGKNIAILDKNYVDCNNNYLVFLLGIYLCHWFLFISFGIKKKMLVIV